MMAMDASTRAWLEQELQSALGFPEVGDIAAYIASSFRSKGEVAAYLEELLGIPPSRAAAIGGRLFPSAAPAAAAAPAKKQPQKRPQQQRAKDSNAPAAAPLVVRPVEANSRLKPAKNLHGAHGAKSAAGGARSSHVTNCLRCGRIEHNSGRKCAFCDSPLHYGELPASFDLATGDTQLPIAATASVEDQEASELLGDTGTMRAARMWRNPELPKDAQELLERTVRQLHKDGRKASRPRTGEGQGLGGSALAPRGRVLHEGDTYSVAMA